MFDNLGGALGAPNTTAITSFGAFTTMGNQVIAIDIGQNSFSVWDSFGAGYGGFGDVGTYFSGGSVYQEIVAGDFNNDGVIDIALFSGGQMEIYHRDGSGGDFEFSDAHNSRWGSQPSMLMIGDLKNDGYDDVFNYDQGNLQAAYYFSLLDTTETTQNAVTLGTFSLTTAEQALLAFATLDAATDSISKTRSGMGASIARIGVALGALAATKENYEAAASRIRDVDVARESADFVRLTFLQQSGVAILAQANLAPRLALDLTQRSVTLSANEILITWVRIILQFNRFPGA